jgi:two-component system, OmpR family, sensor kinase
MLARLQEGIESQRRFVADASHDLRTPLTVMGSEIDVGLETPHLGEKEARDLLASNREEVERMSRMVDNLLTLASLDDGQLELILTPTDLQPLAHDVVDELRGFASTSGVQLSANGDPASVIGDPDRLKQVLSNLVENAVKYAGAGAGVQVSTWQRGGETGVTVSDTGPGIPAEAIPLLFDRFFRLDGSRSSARQGSGLGLAICSDIVSAHGGRIWVESAEGEGSSFSIALPTR